MRSDLTAQFKSNNLDYMIDPKIRNINRLVNLRFEAVENDTTRNLSDKYCMLLANIKDFNAFINDVNFFWSSRKKWIWQSVIKWHEKRVGMTKKWDYITWHLSDYSYNQSCYKLVGRDLSSKAVAIIPQ